MLPQVALAMLVMLRILEHGDAPGTHSSTCFASARGAGAPDQDGFTTATAATA